MMSYFVEIFLGIREVKIEKIWIFLFEFVILFIVASFIEMGGKMTYNDARYKRDEPYRFQFNESIIANYTLKKPSNNYSNISSGKLKVLDISLNGLKIETDVDISLVDEVILSTTVKIANYHFTLMGQIVWRKKYTHTMYRYGVKLTDSDHQANLKYALIEYRKQIQSVAD